MTKDAGKTTGANDGGNRPRQGPSSQPFRLHPMVAIVMVTALVAGACSGGGTETTTADSAPATTLADAASTTSVTAAATTEPDSTTSSAPAAAATTSSTVSAIDPLEGLIVRVDQILQFAPGGTSATIEGAVIRGERDAYRLEASAGQTLQISIVSLEDNAVFDLYGPDSARLGAEATTTATVLPADGDYLIVVGGTRGNASYTLTISIPA